MSTRRGVMWTGSLLFAGLLYALVLKVCYSFPCDNTVVGKFPSPDGRHKVLVFVRSCHATVPNSTQASLLDWYDLPPWGVGNLFVADSNHGKAPYGSWPGPDLKVRWVDDSTVSLSHHPSVGIYRAVHDLNGVTVRYETVDEPHN